MPAHKRRRPHRREDIGEVVFPIERMLAAREVSSGCVGVEALLESDARIVDDRVRNRLAQDRSRNRGS